MVVTTLARTRVGQCWKSAHPGPVRAELVTHHDLPYDVALTIAKGAVEACAAKGYPESAVVVDRDGEMIVSIRGNNAAPHTIENARRKAYTATSFIIRDAIKEDKNRRSIPHGESSSVSVSVSDRI